MWGNISSCMTHWQRCFDVLIFLSLTGTGTVAAPPCPAPHPTATTLKTPTDDPAPPAQSDSDGKFDDGEKKKTERMNSHFPLGCSCFCMSFFCLFVFIYFKCTLFCFIVCRFLNAQHWSLLLFVCWAECVDGRVETCACWCGFIITGLVGLIFHYFGHVTDLRVCGGVWGGRGGGTALSLFLAHYIFINNVIAVFIISATTIFI